MQSGSGGPGRVGPAGRAGSTSSAAASPYSSSSGFEQQQQQQQQQQQSRQAFWKPEGNESLVAYQAGALQGGVVGRSNSAAPPVSMQMAQQSRKFFDLSRLHGAQEGQNRSQGVEQQAQNPVPQAYLQYAFQAAQQKQALAMQTQQQLAKMGMLGSTSGKEQEMLAGNLKLQEPASMQSASQAQALSFKNSPVHFTRGDKPVEHGKQLASELSNEQKPQMHPPGFEQVMPKNVMVPMQASEMEKSIHNMANNQVAMATQFQAMQAWALQRNIDLSNSANPNLMAQIIPLMQQSRMVPQPKVNDNNPGPQSSSIAMPKQQVTSPPAPRESSPRIDSPSDVSGQTGSSKAKQAVPSSSFGTINSAGMISNNNNRAGQQFAFHSKENQVPSGQTTGFGNGMVAMRSPLSASNMEHGSDQPFLPKNASTEAENMQIEQVRQLNRSSSQSTGQSNDGNSDGSRIPPQGGPVVQSAQNHAGFTKQQLHVLKAQILAFRRLKKGEGTLPQELLRAIAPPPLEMQPQQQGLPSDGGNEGRSGGKMVDEPGRQSQFNAKDSQVMPRSNGQSGFENGAFVGEKKVSAIEVAPPETRESNSAVPAEIEQQQTKVLSVKEDQEAEQGIEKGPARSDPVADRGKAVVPQFPTSDPVQAKKPAPASTAPQPKDASSARKYHGPLFDFPFFTRRHDSSGSGGMTHNNNNLTLAYDLKDLLSEEGIEVLNKKRSDSLKKINGLLAVNLERKRIRPDLVLRLQIEQKKLRLLDVQARLKDEMDQQQQEIMAMPDRPYRKFVRLCERQRMEMMRQLQASQKAMREKQWKSIFQWRKKLLEAHWAIRDSRTARNRGVAKYHERMLREFSKRKDDDRNKRMEALKNNDVDRYREMLLEQQTNIPGDAAERYAVLSSFLSQTEEYLHKLGSKITAAKNQQEVEEAANAAAAAARQQGLSEEEVRAAAACAGEEVMIRNQFIEMNAPKDSSSVNKYYTLAHAVNEKVARQPSMLRAGTLRDYQLVGLQWMLSLYNNKLNGILADEMGLGKTVQVMALIAYLMEFKGNYGPHLIIVPNAVLVNWKSEFLNWLPSVSCIFYVGNKEQRSRLFSQEVCSMKYNVLVTTYEFVMYDRSKLSKVDWKYIIIDEAQRMKDRESVLARDLDRYRCQRRLLLTGTPLQNDLKELWSLLNLLLPEVFDNRKAFHDWFSKPFQKEGPTDTEDDWLETEKKVIIIHRLHQILEPFMLRRRVEDVEGSLPPKVSIVLKCRMSAFQSAIYDWVKSTGTLRVDPEDEMVKAQRNPMYQAKMYKTLNNRCMELRKTCNHPLLNYPYFNAVSKEFLVRSCGKLWILDRILIKLQNTGHRVLLFSTMTKLLDIVEEYLQWRRLVYRRIDGTTSLEDRESAIVDFNSPDSDCFIFLLSIRAAGRGLNLQSADTVIIYDPDPNPKNEEQAVARAHRIGQTREVKVIYMEAVVDKIPSHQKEDELRNGGALDLEDELIGKDRYMGSIESLIRNNIQQYKIEMADEVINAGRFDQRTTHEERRTTLETLLHDEERYQETVHDVPSLQEVNRMIARSEEEVELFDQMDEELDWTEEMTRFDKVPKWLRASSKEVNAVIANLSKKPSKNILFANSMGGAPSQMETEKKRGRPKGRKAPNYKEIEDDDGGFSEASSEDRNGYSDREEEGEIQEFEDDESSEVGVLPVKDQSEDEGTPAGNLVYEYPRASESTRENLTHEEAGSLGSSSDSRRMTRMVSPVSPQKFGSLSALDGRPGSLSKKTSDELEEGEIAVFGDSQMGHQQSESGIQERDDGDGEQVLQPKIKRKRSIRLRPRHMVERPDDRSVNEMPREDNRPPLQVSEHKYEVKLRTERAVGELKAMKQDQSDSSRNRRSLPSRRMADTSKLHASPKSTRSNLQSLPMEDNTEYRRESWDEGTMAGANSMSCSKMSDLTHRKCKNVISKFQRRIDKEGQQIVPLLTDLWKRGGNSSSNSSGNNLLDVRKIEQRVDRFVYNGVMELVRDVQSMLKKAMQFYGFSHEVRSEARKVHDLFFDILKIAFPDTDFREARDTLSFSGSVTAASTRLAAIGQSKRKRSTNEVGGTDSGSSTKQRGPVPTSEGTRIRVHVPQRDTKPGNISGASREQYLQPDDSPLHPGDLVICKKKRKDRDKSAVKLRPGSSGPVSPPSSMARQIVSPRAGSSSNPKDARQTPPNAHQQGWTNHSQSANGSREVGWANHVKRLRTDSGKRRPSH